MVNFRVVEINGGDLVTRLYQPQLEDNYFDFSIDENGLWGIFGLAVDNNTVVMKMDAYTLDIQYMWNISLNHHQVCNINYKPPKDIRINPVSRCLICSLSVESSMQLMMWMRG